VGRADGITAGVDAFDPLDGVDLGAAMRG